MIAFHGETGVKEKYIKRVKAHALADEIVHGRYWENGKGCAVGCTIHSPNHRSYEQELGIPRILAHLEDRIFEGMQNGHSKKFPLRFLSAIEPGADLSLVWYQFAHWLLADPHDGVLKFAKADKTKEATQLVADLHGRAARGLLVKQHEWVSARKIAYAAYVAADAADPAAAAYAAAYAAYAAADAADAAAAAADAYAAAARHKAYKRQADKLVELLAAAPVSIAA